MSDAISPKQIKKKIETGKLKKKEAIDSLLSLIEKTNKTSIRRECLNIVGNLGIKTKNLFERLENIVLSDDSPELRAAAAESLIKIFPKESVKPIKWVIEHERHVLVLLKVLWQIFTQEIGRAHV